MWNQFYIGWFSLFEMNLITSSSNTLCRINNKVQNEYSSIAITINYTYYFSGPLKKMVNFPELQRTQSMPSLSMAPSCVPNLYVDLYIYFLGSLIFSLITFWLLQFTSGPAALDNPNWNNFSGLLNLIQPILTLSLYIPYIPWIHCKYHWSLPWGYSWASSSPKDPHMGEGQDKEENKSRSVF